MGCCTSYDCCSKCAVRSNLWCEIVSKLKQKLEIHRVDRFQPHDNRLRCDEDSAYSVLFVYRLSFLWFFFFVLMYISIYNTYIFGFLLYNCMYVCIYIIIRFFYFNFLSFTLQCLVELCGIGVPLMLPLSPMQLIDDFPFFFYFYAIFSV